MIVKIEDIEVRGCAVKQSKKDGSDYMVMRFEDSTGEAHEIVDRDMSRQPFYKRGTQGDLYCTLDIAKAFTRFEVSEFHVK